MPYPNINENKDEAVSKVTDTASYSKYWLPGRTKRKLNNIKRGHVCFDTPSYAISMKMSAYLHFEIGTIRGLSNIIPTYTPMTE